MNPRSVLPLAMLLFLLAACGQPLTPTMQAVGVISATDRPTPPTVGRATASPTPTPQWDIPGVATPTLSGALATLYIHGGLCADPRHRSGSECRELITIARDGRAQSNRLNADTTYETQLPEAQVAELARLIAGANYDALRSERFTDACPTAYDGSERIVTFYTPSGPQQIAGCTNVIRWEHPLFRALDRLAQQVKPVTSP